MSHKFNKKRYFFGKYLYFLFIKLIRPNSRNEDTSRIEFILNISLLVSVFLTTVAFLQTVRSSIVQGEMYKGDSPLFIGLILCSFVSLLVLSRKGFVKSASYAIVLFYFLPISYGVYYFGVDQPQTLLSYAIVIVMAGILAGTRFAFFITLAITLVLFTVGLLQLNGFHEAHLYWKQADSGIIDIIIFSITFNILAVVSWLSNREIEKSLVRARGAERDLRAERDSLEVKVKERTRELERAQFEKTEQMHRFVEFGRMASGLFHDMVNPVQASVLSLEHLKKVSLEIGRPDLKELADEAVTQMEKAKSFINAARNQITRQEINISFDPEEQIALVFQMLSFRAKREKVQLIYAEHPTQLLLTGNPLSFNRIVAGLASNAIDAYDEIPTENGRPRTVTVTTEKQGKSLCISVIDNGKGISEEHQQKIFQLFFTTKGMEKGTGIGLALCKEIVEKEFGGSLSFISKEGSGSTFMAKLPIKN